jgi:hypothetical protein
MSVTTTNIIHKDILADEQLPAVAKSFVLVADPAATTDLETGTVVGIVTATKKVKPYNSGNTDGSEVAVGILKTFVNKEARVVDQRVGVFLSGFFKKASLVGYNSTAKTALNAREVYLPELGADSVIF